MPAWQHSEPCPVLLRCGGEVEVALLFISTFGKKSFIRKGGRALFSFVWRGRLCGSIFWEGGDQVYLELECNLEAV